MNTALSLEMSYVNYMNSEAYIEVGCDPWQRVCNLFVAIRSLSEFLKKKPNSLKKCFKVV
jgi:hypothetical protein